MTDLLANKVVLITGGASGIGRATSRIAAREGARVVVVDFDAKRAGETVDLIREAGGTGAFIQADVSKQTDVAAAVGFAVATYGRLDGAFNNAAVPEPFTDILDANEETFARIMSVNVKGVWLCMREEIRQMRKQGDGGSIVNTASTAGLRGAAKMAIYSASKHAVIGLTRSAALEYARTGPRINAVCPGVIDTPMLQGVIADDARARQGFMNSQPNRRFGQPEEIGEAVVWLLSDHASLVTCTAFPVDGGMAG